MDDSRIYSCDDHLDLYAVPPHLWESRLPRALVERGPRVVVRDGETHADGQVSTRGFDRRPPGLVRRDEVGLQHL